MISFPYRRPLLTKVHQTLAEMVVSPRVVVSKEMARFRREGLIEPRGKGRIFLERPFFALRLDHNVRLPAVEGIY